MKKPLSLSVGMLLVLAVGLAGCMRSAAPALQANVDRMMADIETLAGSEFSGRASGTPGGDKAEEWLAEQFSELGLEPAGEDGTYFQGFSARRGNPGEHVLEVLDGDSVVKSYSYGVDMTYYTVYEHSGGVTASGVVAGALENLEAINGQICLVSSNAGGSDPLFLLGNKAAEGYGGVIVGGGNVRRFKAQAVRSDNGPTGGLPRMLVTASVFDELIKYTQQGYFIHMKSAWQGHDYRARNVLGMLKASRPSDQYLMISAHIDGLEPDFDGVWYPGAFDNASGVAAMLEIARQFKEQKLKPSVNLVFVGFAGEEPLLDGSTYYASDPLFPLENTKVINMDGIGAKADADLLFLVAGGMNRGNPFVQEFEQTARTLGYTARVVPDDYSDHRPLAEKGVPAVTVDDDDQYSWHLPTDDIYNISRERLERDFDVTMAVVLEETGLRGK